MITRLSRAGAWNAEFSESLVLLIFQSKTEKLRGSTTL